VLVKKSWLLNTRDCVSSFLSREPFEVAAVGLDVAFAALAQGFCLHLQWESCRQAC